MSSFNANGAVGMSRGGGDWGRKWRRQLRNEARAPRPEVVEKAKAKRLARAEKRLRERDAGAFGPTT